jgi:DNA-binding NarL/FixJ family response regulator
MTNNRTQTQAITIAIADDHQIFIDGLCTILKETDRLDATIVATANNGEHLLVQLKRSKPDLLILDMNMPGKDGLEVLDAIKGIYPNMKIIVMSMFDDTKIVREVLNLGAHAYLLKTAGAKMLLTAIDEVLDNATFVDPALGKLNSLHTGNSSSDHGSPYEQRFVSKYDLTKREIEILRFIALAKNNKEIGSELFISEQTVGVHRKNIMRKLQVNSTAALIKLAYDHSLV